MWYFSLDIPIFRTFGSKNKHIWPLSYHDFFYPFHVILVLVPSYTILSFKASVRNHNSTIDFGKMCFIVLMYPSYVSFIFIFQKCVPDMSWSPRSSTVFACVNEGAVEVWDLSLSVWVLIETEDFLNLEYEIYLYMYWLCKMSWSTVYQYCRRSVVSIAQRVSIYRNGTICRFCIEHVYMCYQNALKYYLID